MTKEEKIELLNRLLEIEEKNDIGNLTSMDRREFQQWFELLEQEPCEDVVSRQSMIDCFKKWQPYMATRIYEYEQELKALPSVTPKPKTDVLDKIRAEIKALSPEPTAYDVVDGNPIKDAVWETLADVLQIIDKYKMESEESE